jgi:hypothetical protein
LLAGSTGSCMGGSELEWCARGLLRLSCKVGGLCASHMYVSLLQGRGCDCSSLARVTCGCGAK